MSHKFHHKCSRRSTPKSSSTAIASFGAGSGGGPVEINELDVPDYVDEGGRLEQHDGAYSVHANRVEFVACPPLPPATPVPYVISLFAAGEGMDGNVEIRGSKGVRITSGPPPLPP